MRAIMMQALVLLLIVSSLVGCDSQAPQARDGKTQQPLTPTAMVATESQQLEALLDDYWEGYLRLRPLSATYYGDPRYNGVLPDVYSADYREAMRRFRVEYLEQVQRIDRSALSSQDMLSYDLFVRQQKLALEGTRFPAWLIPIDQYSLYGSLAQLGSGRGSQPFNSLQDYEDWFSRLAPIDVLTDTAIANMREGVARGYSQPQEVVKKTIGLLDALIVDDLEQSAFWGAIAAMPAAISEASQRRLVSEYRALLGGTVMPAYIKMRNYLRDDYLLNCRDSYGYLALPQGKPWYQYLVKVQTSTSLTPREIHEFGKQEVSRILDEMRQVRDTVKFKGDLQQFFEYLRTDERFYFRSADEVIAAYQALSGQVRSVLPAYFDIFPKTELEVRPVEAFRAATAAGASYMRGNPDGSRPGIFYVNTYNLKAQPAYGTQTLYLHEAEPGHHFSISIAQEIAELPKFRRFSSETAFSEGWALYAESIGREMGLFSDPFQYFGKLNDEQLRAMRLVVDTGLHYYGWSRDQARDYMQANSTLAESDIESEVDRYMASPAQALAYKVGERAIRGMRDRAEKALAERFDIKAFHRQILIDGSLPMDLLDQKIDKWIAAQLRLESQAQST